MTAVEQELRAKLQQAISHLKPLLQETKEKQDQINALLQESNQKNDQINTLLKDSTEKNDHINTLLLRQNDLESSVFILQNSLKDRDLQVSSLKNTLDEKEAAHAHELNILIDNNHALENTVALLSGNIQSLNDQVSTQNSQIYSLKSDIENLQSRLNASNESSGDPVDDLGPLHSEISALLGKLQACQDKLDDSLHLNKNLQSDNEALLSNNTRLEDDLKVTTTELISLRDQTISSDSVILQLKTDVKELEKSLSIVNATVESLNDDKQVLQENVNAANKSNITLSSSIQELSLKNSQLTNEKEALMDKLKSLKNTIAPRMQQEMTQNSILSTEINTLNEQLSNLKTERDLLKSQLDQLVVDSQSNNLKELENSNAGLQTELEKTKRKLTALQNHLLEIQDSSNLELLNTQTELSEYKMRVEELEHERETWDLLNNDARQECDELLIKIKDLQLEIESHVRVEQDYAKARESDLKALNNLQSVLEEFQASKEADINLALETLKCEVSRKDSEIQALKVLLESATEKISQIDFSLPPSSQLQAQLTASLSEITNLKSKTYLAESVRRAATTDLQVDRVLVSNLLVQFLQRDRGDPKRYEMLSVISSVLRFSDEEKVLVGLLRKSDGGKSPVTESMTDLWINFLIKESSGKRQME